MSILQGVGHFARNCSTVCFKCKGGQASDSCPNRRRWEHVPADEDDFRSVVSDLGTGDDVTADPVESSANSAEVDVASAACTTDVSATESSASNRVASFNFLAPRPPQTSAVSQSSTTYP